MNSGQEKPFSPVAVWRVAWHDVFGTKDVQNPITASYVWLADQAGHVGLGFFFSAIASWTWWEFYSAMVGDLPNSPMQLLLNYPIYCLGLFAIFIILLGIIWKKEADDFRQVHQDAAGGTFRFDAKNLRWNIRTVLFFFGVGAALPTVFFFNKILSIFVFLAGVILSLVIGFWWLRRKIAFQQADLPYLFRLADFTADIEAKMTKNIVELTKRNPEAPECNHIIIHGPLNAGKTSLATGIGTEFAFKLGRPRYFSLIKLLQLAAARPSWSAPGLTEQDAGRQLWQWERAEMLIVDDLDAGLEHAVLVHPKDVAGAMLALRGERPLAWLAAERSVWVCGPNSDIQAWRATIAGFLGIAPAQIGVIALAPRQAAVAPSVRSPSPVRRELVGSLLD